MSKKAMDTKRALQTTKQHIDDLIQRKDAKKLTENEFEERAIEIGLRLTQQIQVLSLNRRRSKRRKGLLNKQIAQRLTRMGVSISPDTISRYRYAKQTASPERREALRRLYEDNKRR